MGCRQVRTSRRLPSGRMATVMEYDMEDFLISCVDKFKELAGVKDVRPCPTPFITETHEHSPAGRAGTGPCVECPWCKHTFPPHVYESVDALEASKRAQKKKVRAPTKDSDGEADSASVSGGRQPADEKGKLAPIASRILMKILWAARLSRFDLLRAVVTLRSSSRNGLWNAIANSSAWLDILPILSTCVPWDGWVTK